MLEVVFLYPALMANVFTVMLVLSLRLGRERLGGFGVVALISLGITAAVWLAIALLRSLCGGQPAWLFARADDVAPLARALGLGAAICVYAWLFIRSLRARAAHQALAEAAATRPHVQIGWIVDGWAFDPFEAADNRAAELARAQRELPSRPDQRSEEHA